jgi:hypothetical protein
MHEGGWMGMGGMNSYWLVPVLIVVIAIFALALIRRSRGGR